MKLVREHIEFERGQEPREAMNIGLWNRIRQEASEYGKDINFIDPSYALQWAVTEGKTEYIQYLLDKGADIDVDHGFPIRWAALDGYVDIVKILIENGSKYIQQAYDFVEKNDNKLEKCLKPKRQEIMKILKSGIKNES